MRNAKGDVEKLDKTALSIRAAIELMPSTPLYKEGHLATSERFDKASEVSKSRIAHARDYQIIWMTSRSLHLIV
jgi:hypothetical protein